MNRKGMILVLCLAFASCATAPALRKNVPATAPKSLADLRKQSFEQWHKNVDIKLEQQTPQIRQAIKLAFEAGYDQGVRDVADVMPKEK